MAGPKNYTWLARSKSPRGGGTRIRAAAAPVPPRGSASFADRAVSADHTSADNVSLSTRAICAALALLLRDYCCERTRPITMAAGVRGVVNAVGLPHNHMTDPFALSNLVSK